MCDPGGCALDGDCPSGQACTNGACASSAPSPEDAGPAMMMMAPDAGACAPAIVRVSVGTGGIESDGDALPMTAISADGRFVAFSSAATNLVAQDTNARIDVFVHDVETGSTARVSVAEDGAQLEEDSGWVGQRRDTSLSLSADGRRVVFASLSNEVVPGLRGNGNLFVRDRARESTELVTRSSLGEIAVSGSKIGVISGDGRYVAFHSVAANLVPGDTTRADIFVRDLEMGITTALTHDEEQFRRIQAINSDGSLILSTYYGDGGEFPRHAPLMHETETSSAIRFPLEIEMPDFLELSMSDDGEVISFHTIMRLDPRDPSQLSNQYLYFRSFAEFVPMEVTVSGEFAEQSHVQDRTGVSADGSRAVFVTRGRLEEADLNDTEDIYIFDVENRRAHVVSAGLDRRAAGSASAPAISADGRWVVFWSEASNLVEGDTNSAADIFRVRICF